MVSLFNNEDISSKHKLHFFSESAIYGIHLYLQENEKAIEEKKEIGHILARASEVCIYLQLQL